MLYSPAEDSYLIAHETKKYCKAKDVLDIGSGSGILAQTAKNAGAKSVLASDINAKAIKNIKSKGINAIQSDLFSKIKGKFDLIIFNPPYLPEDKKEDEESARVTTGGKRGDEIILKFLKQSINHLNKDGIILLLLSSLTPKKRILDIMKKMSYHHKIIASKKLFFEELFVYKITLKAR